MPFGATRETRAIRIALAARAPGKARGATENPPGRFEHWRRAQEPEAHREQSAPPTEIRFERARTIVCSNDSPDIPFRRSVNPYRGCEHGCIYCYARPSHAYLGLSPGLDFETKIYAKANAAELLRRELARPDYRPEPIAFGTNTDCYQPAERRLRIMRAILELLAACRHPLTITTKSALVERDLDLLAPMARAALVRVYVSVPTLDERLARRLEPRAPSPARRIQTLAALAAAGVPCGVMVAPVVPALTDAGIENVLETAARAGARTAGWVLLRLPWELRPLFEAWLERHVPLRASHVLSLLRALRAGQVNDPRFGTRMTGEGPYAELLARRFALACRRFGLAGRDAPPLETRLFRPPAGAQGELF